MLGATRRRCGSSLTRSAAHIGPQPPSALRVAGGAGSSASRRSSTMNHIACVASGSHTMRRRTQRNATHLRRATLDSRAVADKTSYRESGVNIDAQDEALREVRHIARSTFTPGVMSDIGSFGGLFRGTFEGIEKPVLVSSTDGVGTKLRVAQAMKIHDTVGYDLVCHCVNDILVQGATPLFFLDYYATGKLRPPVMTDVIRGMARACRENGAALIGGETAEMPGFYSDDDYDVAGFILGVVDSKIGRAHV